VGHGHSCSRFWPALPGGARSIRSLVGTRSRTSRTRDHHTRQQTWIFVPFGAEKRRERAVLCSSEGKIRRRDKIIPSALGELKSVSIARGANRAKTIRFAPNEHPMVLFVTYMMHFRTTPGPWSHFDVDCTQGYIVTNQTTNLTARNNQLLRTQESLPYYVAFESSCPSGLAWLCWRASKGLVLLRD
jgi:hypothetical protein